jgi:putative ABC transport system permease protein
MAALIKALMSALNFDLPADGLIIRPSAAILSVVAGTIVTLVAAVFPARAASRVPPIAALRDVAIEQRDRMRVRTVLGAVVTLLGMGLLLGTLAAGGDGILPRIGLGAFLTFIGVTILGPVFAKPVTRVLGAPLPRMRGAAGTLARENAMRNPKRTARTAAALMIGVALVSAITVLAASVQKSFDKVIGEQFRGDYVVGAGGFGNDAGFSPEVGRALRTKPELAAVMPIRATMVRADFGTDRPKDAQLFAVDGVASDKITDIRVRQGDLTTLKADGIAVYDKWARKRGLGMGDKVTITFVDTGPKVFEVRTVYGNHDLSGDYFVDLPAFDANVRAQFDQQILIKATSGVPSKQVRAAIESVTDAYPNIKVRDRQEFIDTQGNFIQSAVYFIYGMLALAVIIALFGIANTLALSVVERTRELGLLRAVGMTRRQLRSSIRWEAALMALFGIAGGLAVGVFFGWALMQGFRSQGLRELALPAGRLVAIALVVLVLSVTSAVIPAWRAGRLDVLDAIGHD